MTEQNGRDFWELNDFRTPWCIHVAATLRIAHFINDGLTKIDELAIAAGCDPYYLHAVMGHLVSNGIFEEPRPGEFVLNHMARQFLDPITTVSLNLDGLGGRFAYAWGTLLKLVRTGRPAYEDVFKYSFWDDLKAHPQLAQDFDRIIGPEGHGTPEPSFNITGGWEAVNTVVDVGGGTGAMLAGILKMHPHLNGILVDQPDTVARSEDVFREAGVMGRVKKAGQSFFDPLPVGADIYIFRGILNDWPDREALQILGRCAEASPQGRVIVLKSVEPDRSSRDVRIEMVLLGGKQRSITEFGKLARQAGLEILSSGWQPEGGYFVVECRPG